MGGWTDLEEVEWESVVWISPACSCKCDSKPSGSTK
jgi:hypothetical protein